jgi:RecG-like helicase
MGDSNIAHNYQDIIFKKMTELFKDETLEYYGLNLPKIVSVKPTELPTIKVSNQNMDFVFELEDNSLLHLEFQTTHKKADLLRFLQYDLALYAKEKRKINTVVIYSGKYKKAKKGLEIGPINYTVQQVFMIKYDGVKRYQEIKEKIEKSEELTDKDLMDIVFLALMKNEKEEEEVVEEAASPPVIGE